MKSSWLARTRRNEGVDIIPPRSVRPHRAAPWPARWSAPQCLYQWPVCQVVVEPVRVHGRQRCGGIQVGQLRGGQLDIDRAEIILELLHLAGAEDDARDGLARQQPCERYLGHAR